jgi:hypothetical protein
MDAYEELTDNLARVRERMAIAARSVGRDPAEVALVAVTKTHSIELIEAACRAGLRDLGENRVEEASEKIPVAHERLDPARRPRWHMIGHLQRRKAEQAVALFDMIHSVDSLRLAQRIGRFAGEQNKVLPVLLEVNVSGEASKYGFELSERADAQTRAAFWTDVEHMLALPHVQVCGLMTMAPIVAQAEQARPVFAALRTLRDDLRRRFPQADWRELSMGMTDDFEVAIQEGATMVRIGRAIFGSRR